MKLFFKVAMVLVWIGALNWGFVGAFDFNVVSELFGNWPTVEKVVYIVVGVAALVLLGSKKWKIVKR